MDYARPLTTVGDEHEVFKHRRFEDDHIFANNLFTPLVKMLPEPPRFDQLGLSLLELWGERFDEVYEACENLLAVCEGHPMAVEQRNHRSLEKSSLYINCVTLANTGTQYNFNLRLTAECYSEPWLVGRELGLTPAACMMLTNAMLDLYYVPEYQIAAVNQSRSKGLSYETSKIRCPALQKWCGKAFEVVRQIIEMSQFVEDLTAKVTKTLSKTERDKMGYNTLEYDLFGLIHPRYNAWKDWRTSPHLKLAQEYSRVEHFPIIKTIRKSLDYLRAIDKSGEAADKFPVGLIGCTARRVKV